MNMALGAVNDEWQGKAGDLLLFLLIIYRELIPGAPSMMYDIHPGTHLSIPNIYPSFLHIRPSHWPWKSQRDNPFLLGKFLIQFKVRCYRIVNRG